MQLWRAIDPDQDAGPVMIEKGSWFDPARGHREVPWKIYYPGQGQGPYPVIVWSHGLGGSRDGAGFLARYLASHGYVVVNIQHRGTDETLWQGKPGHPWDVIRATHIPRRATLQRYQDVPFALDQLKGWRAEKVETTQLMDLSRIGMSGHSFGALTTQVMAGQSLGRGRRRYDLFEPRFKCAIAYSPSPGYNRTEPVSQIYGSIRLPMLYITGTDDTSPITREDYRHRLEMFGHARGSDQHLLVIQDADHMVYNGSRGQLGATSNRALHERIIRVAALAFWDAYLNDNAQARLWLHDGKFADWLNGHGRFEFRA